VDQDVSLQSTRVIYKRGAYTVGITSENTNTED
jgi:hypothetical protein